MTHKQRKGRSGRVIVFRRSQPVIAAVRAMREGTTGRVMETAPRVWAVGRPSRCQGERVRSPVTERAAPPPAELERPQESSTLAFYRKYTEALLRRYMRLSLEAGRVPSLMGREMFRGNVTHYRVRSFEDVVVFCHDVEKRLAQLGPLDKQLVKRIGLQQYTQDEVAGMLGMSLRSVVRLYAEALDRLTRYFLKDRLLEPQKCCQEG